MDPSREPSAVPEGFRAGLTALRAALAQAQRPDLHLTEVAAPTRLAPHALAVVAEVLLKGEVVATGRFVVLHDPQGQEGWRGDTRVVALVQADTDPEMAADSALAAVGWSWLLDALDARDARHTAAGGTVTRTVSSRFGALAEPEEDSEVEIRASWTPVTTDGAGSLGAHLGAWCDLLGATAGLPPPGVTALRPAWVPAADR